MSPSNRPLIFIFYFCHLVFERKKHTFLAVEVKRDKAETLILSINMILVICIPEAKQIGRQVLFIRRIYGKWTFSFSASLYLTFHILSDAVIVMSSLCFSLSFSLTQRNSTVYNISFVVPTSIQSNKINQNCLARSFCQPATLVSSREKQVVNAREFFTGVIRYRAGFV